MDDDEEFQQFWKWRQTISDRPEATHEQIIQEFLKFNRWQQTSGDRAVVTDRPTATNQRLQTGGNKPTAVNQIGQQTSLQKVPQGQQLKLKWSPEKRDAVCFQAFHGIKYPADPLSWGTNDELEALAKMYNVNFIV